jgi:hypothetical protein
MKREVNSHHVLWCRKWYKTPIEKTLRSHQGLIVPMYQDVHRQLHAALDPPPKPNSRIILGSLAMLNELSFRTLSDPRQTTMALAEHLLENEESKAQRIGHHIVKQLAFIEEGYYG